MRPRSFVRTGALILVASLVAYYGCRGSTRGAPGPTPPASSPAPLASSLPPDRGGANDQAVRTPEERRVLYARLLDQKIDRFHEQVDADCSSDDLSFVFDDLARVRDAIVESAVATARGDKTKADQRTFENRVLAQHRTDVCRWASTAPLSSACAAHFRYCASPPGPVP